MKHTISSNLSLLMNRDMRIYDLISNFSLSNNIIPTIHLFFSGYEIEFPFVLIRIAERQMFFFGDGYKHSNTVLSMDSFNSESSTLITTIQKYLV